MNTTLTLSEAGLLLIGAFLLVLIFYLILLIKNMIPVVRNTNKVVEQADEIMQLVNQDVHSARKLFEGFSGEVDTAASRAKTNEGLVKALTVAFSIALALKKLMKK